MKVAGATDIGMHREVNEDSILLLPERSLFAVADGMGGHRGGKVASQMVIGELTKAALDSPGPLDADALKSCLESINESVHHMGSSSDALSGMGTTCTAASIYAGQVIVAHVGDSRLYLIRDGAIRRLTSDHRAVQELIDKGTLSESEAESHPMRNLLTRSVGVEESVQVDLNRSTLEPGDALLMCSDGLTEMVPERTIAEAVGDAEDPEDVVDELVRRANARGGQDNISVVVVFVETGDCADDA